jgi:hypothetical protein
MCTSEEDGIRWIAARLRQCRTRVYGYSNARSVPLWRIASYKFWVSSDSPDAKVLGFAFPDVCVRRNMSDYSATRPLGVRGGRSRTQAAHGGPTACP